MKQPTGLDTPQTAHLTEAQLLGYQSRTLAVEERQRTDKHLAGCGECRRTLLARIGKVAIPAEAAALREPLHLEYEELTALLDGKLEATAKERAEDHLFLCASCTRELDGLKKLDAMLASPAEEKAPVKEKAALGQRIAKFFAVPGRKRDFGLAFGAAMAGAFLLTTTEAGPEAVGGVTHGAARLVDWTSHAGANAHMGGFLLVGLGVVLIAYSLWMRR